MSKATSRELELRPQPSEAHQSIFVLAASINTPRAIPNEKKSLPPLQRVPTLPSPRETRSMPLIEKEFRHGQTLTRTNALPTAVHEDDKHETGAPSTPTPSPALGRMRSELEFRSAVQVEDQAASGSERHQANPEYGDTSSNEESTRQVTAQDAPTMRAEGIHSTETRKEKNVSVCHDANDGASSPSSIPRLSVGEVQNTEHPQLQSASDPRSAGPTASDLHLTAQTRLSRDSTDDSNSLVLTPKPQTPRLENVNPSYSRSLARLLTPRMLSATSSPRIHPVAYAPGIDASRDGEDSNSPDHLGHEHGDDSALQEKQVVQKEKKRNGTNSANSETELPTQMVQVAAVPLAATTAAGSEQPPSSLDGAQRSVFLRTQAVIADIFGKPTESHWAKVLNRIMFVCIVLNFSMMAAETCEGKNFLGSDPGYPYLPDEATYKALDTLFSMIFTLELFGRVAVKKFQKAVLMDPFTVIDFCALCPWFGQLLVNLAGVPFSADDMSGPAHFVALLRLLRAARLGNILRHYDQSRILYLSIRASLRPLGITMFFLFTLVMLLATALFYAEPCYNANTCAFTDIFNSAYFIMVTIATVGYGSQVPSLNNWASLMITCVAMLFGQMYFSMPVFIVGNNFQSTYENFQWNNKRKLRQLDETLCPFDAQEMHAFTQHLTNTHFHLLDAWRVVQLNIQKMVRKSKSEDADTKQAASAQATRLAKIKEAAEKLLSVHGETCELLQTFVPHKKKVQRVAAEVRTEGMLSHIYVRARRAMGQKALVSKDTTKDARAISETFRGRLWLVLEVPDSSKLASAINIIMVGFALLSVFLFCCESLPELSATGVNTLACKRAVQEYCAATGFYASAWDPPDAGCFVRDANGTTDFSQQIEFACADGSDAPACYGNGLNFGSLDDAALDCADVFDPAGANVICYRHQCNRIDTIVDMGPYWIYFEWTFGLAFTLELVLRFVASQDRVHLIRDFYIIFDLLAVVPFFVEVIQYVVQDVEPTYAIVATSPSLLSVIRVLKTMRILKLTRVSRSPSWLAKGSLVGDDDDMSVAFQRHESNREHSARRVEAIGHSGERIPSLCMRLPRMELLVQLDAIAHTDGPLCQIFFLVAGCAIAGAIFYEIERGTECFVGKECIWWNKNVLTPVLANGLPDGKRILIQDRRRAILPDMKYSTWLSYTTLTAVGYGDLAPRTSIGKVFCICLVIISTIYSAMPVSLVGSKFYSLYEKHMEKMVVKRGGSSSSCRATKRNLHAADPNKNNAPASTRSIELFGLSDKDLEILRQFISMRRTLINLQRSLDNFNSVGIDILQQRKGSNAGDLGSSAVVVRKTDSIEQSIEQKSNAIMVVVFDGSVRRSLSECSNLRSPFVLSLGHAVAVFSRGRKAPRRTIGVRSSHQRSIAASRGRSVVFAIEETISKTTNSSPRTLARDVSK